MRWITATHLERWADTRTAEGDLPLLIRKLIVASVKQWPDLYIAAGDSIFKPGWDGVCHSTEKNRLLPAGVSRWEWGRNSDYKKKFKKDFTKRTLETPREKQLDEIFVFVTPRRWSGDRESIIKECQSTSHWKGILIYDADDLEMWLEHSPAVARWLCLELQIMTEQVIGAEEFWKSYTRHAEYVFTPEFVLGGRTGNAERLAGFLTDDFDALELKAASKEEGAAFVLAALLSANADKEILVYSKCVIVSEPSVLKQLNDLQKGLVIIYMPVNDETITMLGDIANHIISIVSNRAKVRSRDIILQIPDSGYFSQGLIAIGVPHREAYNLSKICGRSYDVLRRLLSDQAGRVIWPAGFDENELIPLFFVQKFDDEKKGDHDAITALSGNDYSAYKSKLKKWTLITGSPVTQIANKWEAVSPYDLLYIVGKYITEEDLRLFESLFLTVMSAHDPTLDLEPHLRVAASLYKKEDQYSKWLKTGISQTLALLSIFGEDSGINTSIDLHAWINQIVRKLLNAQELRFWQTIESKIDILAEAAPQAFLDKMEDLVQKHPELIAELFNDQESGLWSHPYHTHILWALEVLAWDASLLPRVTFLLAKIIRLDKGTAYANRPAHTLSSIFRWWYPQTFATYQDRKELLNTLAKRFPDVALSLIISLTPQLSEVAMDTHKPVWRMRERYQIKVSQAEYIEGLTFNCDKLLELAGSDPQKWVRVIELADDHQGFLRDKIIEKILTIDFDTAKSDNLRERLYTLMRSHAAATKKDSSWRLSSEHQAALKQVYDKINRSAADRYISYFNVEYIESRSTGDDWEKQQKLTAKKRTEAIGLIIKDGGLESVYEMIPKVKYPFWVGRALSKVHKKLNTDVILKIEDGENFQRAVIGYISGFAEEHGTTWIEKQVKHFTGKLADQHLIAFYLATEACPVIWESVKKQNTALYNLYWQVIFTGFYHPWFSAENNDAVIQHLNSYKRYSTSLNCIYDEKRLKPETVAATLIGYVTDNTETDKPLRSQEYQIRKLYKYLLAADYDPDQMHLMEWYYFKLLKKDGHEKSLITYLYDNLNKHPDFFARLVQFLYIPEEGTPEEEIKGMSAENVQGRAQNADAVLNGWIELPGLTKDGTADFEVLKQYITDAFEQCSILKRKKHGTREIGKLLGRAEVPGSDWPHPEICEIIESYDYPDLNEGFFSGYYNRHAGEVRIRPATASYDSDSSEVVHLKALSQNLGSKYPVTARIINDIALSKQHWIDFMNKRDRQDEF